MKYNDLKDKFYILSGPNVIESEEHTIEMAINLKEIYSKYDINFIFKTSFDKANRSSLSSYRGLGFEEGLRILKIVKDKIKLPIITDIHESWQAKPIGEIVDIIQIPAFLCRQTDLLKAAAETGKIIHVKKGQMCSAEQMHKCKEKLIEFGNPNVILCERGNSFGYQDLVVDPRNLIWLKSDTNLVSMDITHCLQKPSQKYDDGTVKSGGYRELIPFMGKMAISLGVNGLFIEVHDNPDKALCDGPTQWSLDRLEWLLRFLDIKEKISKKLEIVVPCRIKSSRLKNKMLMKINGEYVINRTINQIKKSKHKDITLITDSLDIINIIDNHINHIYNIKSYSNGIERISDNIENLDCSHIMIVHGDQPFLNYDNINLISDYYYSNNIDDNEILMGYSFISEEEANDSSIAKIVTDSNDYLLYISRQKIPSNTKNIDIKFKKGVSILIIPKNKVIEYKNIDMSDIQRCEDNEWIKFIDKLNCKIKCIELHDVEQDLNNIDDLNYLLNKYSK